jgi:hypothetical protein
MTQAEFNSWMMFYQLYPFDDYHRHYRPTALMAATFGGDAVKALEWLQPEPVPDGFSDADLRTFKAFGIKPPVKE